MYQYRRPPRPDKPKIPKILYAALALVLVISASIIINHIRSDFRYRHGHNVMAYSPEPAEPYIPAPTPEPTLPPTPEPVPTQEYTPEPEPTPDPGPTPPPRVPRQEFLDHRAHYNNDDIVGHLWIPNTTINYLVTQTTDNVFYLYHDIRGRRSLPGWIFLDYLADLRAQDQNLVIYGHNMRNDHKFHSVRRFLNEDFFRNNRYIYFSTIYADYIFEVFSVHIAHIDLPYIENNYYDWDYWINLFASLSRFDAGIPVSAADRIITLSTCENAYRNHRIVVHGVLISETFPHLEGTDIY